MTQSGHSGGPPSTSANDPVRTFASPEAVEHWSPTTLRKKLIKIGAKVVRHGRYVTFQLAEVAIPRTLFAYILRRIDWLRPKPLPTGRKRYRSGNPTTGRVCPECRLIDVIVRRPTHSEIKTRTPSR